jgi:hypothetical protein
VNAATVVIVTNGRDPADAIAAARATAPVDEAGDVTALVWGSAPSDADRGASLTVLRLAERPVGARDRVVDALIPPALSRALMATGPGRLIHSLLPSDLGRRVWRRVRRTPEAVALLSGARLVIAADPGGVRTAWFALHRLGAERAVIAGQA